MNEEEKLPHLEELLAEPFSYILYTILPINFDYGFPNSIKNKSSLDKKRESILSKLNNLAVLSEWTKMRNFKKWYCSYKEDIKYYSSLNTKKSNASLYDYDDNFFKGNMILGKKDGRGEYDYKQENMIYNGEYKNDLRQGQGKLSAKDGTYYYVGDWMNNQMEVNGILYSSKLGKYTGQFHKDYFEGKGNFVDMEKNEYQGMFHKGLKKGKGELKLNNGNVYIGEFKNDKYNGKGVLKDSKGNILQEGEFKEGVLLKSRKISCLKDDNKSFKDNISNFSKEGSKVLTVNPLNENEEVKLYSIPQNNSIDEDENEEKIFEKENEEENEKEKTTNNEIEIEEDRKSIKEIEEEKENENEEI